MGALEPWYALIQCILHIPNPEELEEDRLTVLISRIRWLFKNKFIYGVQLESQSSVYRNEEELQKEIENLNYGV